jgi:hypothetical protein
MSLPKWLDNHVKRFLASKGYVTFRNGRDAAAIARRATLLASNKIDLVLDVGANIGQYGKTIRVPFGVRIGASDPERAPTPIRTENFGNDPASEFDAHLLAAATLSVLASEATGESSMFVVAES